MKRSDTSRIEPKHMHNENDIFVDVYVKSCRNLQHLRANTLNLPNKPRDRTLHCHLQSLVPWPRLRIERVRR